MILTLTIPDAVAPAAIDNICAATNYTAGSGKTKAQWAKEQIITHVNRLNVMGAQRIAAAAAAATAAANPIT
jgi:hypothetical protein